MKRMCMFLSALLALTLLAGCGRMNGPSPSAQPSEEPMVSLEPNIPEEGDPTPALDELIPGQSDIEQMHDSATPEPSAVPTTTPRQ